MTRMTRIFLGAALVALSTTGMPVRGEDEVTFMPARESAKQQCH